LLFERGQGIKGTFTALAGVEFLQCLEFVRHNQTGLTGFTGFGMKNPLQSG
jgi:hypothetical protein